MDKSKFYTLEYANDYLPYFCRRVKCLRLTDDRIHLLISVAYSIQSNFDEAVYEYRVIDRRSSEVETSFRVDSSLMTRRCLQPACRATMSRCCSTCRNATDATT